MIDCTGAVPSSPEDDIAIIAALTLDATAADALSRALTRQLMPHEVKRFETIESLLAFLDDAATAPNSRIDAVTIDLRHFARALPALEERRRAFALLLAAFPTQAVDAETVDAAGNAGAILIERDLGERDSALVFTAALVEHWFGEPQSRSRKAK
jgi:hypothetical protein